MLKARQRLCFSCCNEIKVFAVEMTRWQSPSTEVVWPNGGHRKPAGRVPSRCLEGMTALAVMIGCSVLDPA